MFWADPFGGWPFLFYATSFVAFPEYLCFYNEINSYLFVIKTLDF